MAKERIIALCLAQIRDRQLSGWWWAENLRKLSFSLYHSLYGSSSHPVVVSRLDKVFVCTLVAIAEGRGRRR